MSEPQRVLFNALSQIISSDANRAGQNAGKAAQDVLLGLVGGVDFTTPPFDATREGLDATPGAGLSVDISAGEVMRYDATTLIGDDTSRYKVGRLPASTNVALGAADPTNPRIDLVRAVITSTNSDNVSRNLLVLPGRTIVPTLVNTTVRPTMTLAVTAGTAAATPAFPAVPAGSVPLWYVYVPALAVSVNTAHLMDMRRYLRTNDVVNAGSAPQTSIGVEPDAAAPTTTVRLRTGVASVFGGGLAVVSAEQTYAFANLIQNGEAAPGTDVQCDFYLVAKGNGVPVGRSEPNGVCLTATGNATASPPSEGGFPPGGGINYYPLFSQGLFNVVFTTTRAAYVGTMFTGGTAALLETTGGAQPLDKGGRVFDVSLGGERGRFTARCGFIRAPNLQWSSATVVQIVRPALVVDGTPCRVQATLNFTMPTDLVSGDAEAASTWYYCYLRLAVSRLAGGTPARGITRRLVARISTEVPNSDGTKPTPETNFNSNDYIFVGSFFNNSASDIEPFYRVGDLVYFRDVPFSGTFHTLHNADVAVTAARTSITAILPSTSRMVIINAEALLTPVAGTLDSTTYRFFHGVGVSAACVDHRISAGDPALGVLVVRSNMTEFIMRPVGSLFEANRNALATAAFNLHVWERGYVEAVAHDFV